MTDVFSRDKRSAVMASVRSKGNRSTELKLAALLRSSGIKGWRRHQQLPGKPDFVFREQRIAVFVDGCFWHGCEQCRSLPATRRTFWRDKILGNKKRDRAVTRELRAKGWAVLRFWEHQLTSETRVLASIKHALALGD